MGAATQASSVPTPIARHRTRLLGHYWPLAPVLVGVVLLMLPTLALPFGPDQAIFAVIGATINRGGFPFVDAWDQKPPGIYLLYSLALRLPGPLMMRVRLFDLGWTLATVVLLYELARGLWSPRAGVLAALLFGAVYATMQGYWHLAQPDGLLGLPLLAATLLVLRAAPGPRGAAAVLIAGALLGFAFQLRFTAAPLVPTVMLVLAWQHPQERQQWLRKGRYLAAGFALAQVALAAYLVAGSAFGAYLEAVRFATGYTGAGWPFAPRERTLSLFFAFARSSTLSWLTAAAMLSAPALAGAFACWTLRPDPHARALTAAALLAFAGIAAQQKFFWYHWQLLLPLLALLAGWALDQAFAAIEQDMDAFAAGVAKAALVGGLLLATPSATDGVYTAWDEWLHRDDTRLTRVRYDNQFGAYGDVTYSYLADVQVAAYLHARTSADERVYVFGYDPLIYLQSGRASASRFIYTLPLMSVWAPDRWKDEFVAEIAAAAPRYIAVQSYEGGAPWITGQTDDTAAWSRKISGFATLLDSEYEHEVDIEHFSLYRRRTP